MAVERILKAMVMVNAVTDPINRRYSVIYFEDAERNRYEYSGVEQIFFALFLLKPSYFFQFALKYKKIFFAKEKCSHGQHEEKK